MVLNCLAHSDVDVLSCAAEDPPAGRSGWSGALSFLAHDLLTSATSPDGIMHIQRHTFVPLELELLSGRTPMPTRPRELVEVVQAFSSRRKRHA